MPTTLLGTCVLGVRGWKGGYYSHESVQNEKGIAVEELELSFLMGHGYKWMAAANTVTYD